METLFEEHVKTRIGAAIDKLLVPRPSKMTIASVSVREFTRAMDPELTSYLATDDGDRSAVRLIPHRFSSLRDECCWLGRRFLREVFCLREMVVMKLEPKVPEQSRRRNIIDGYVLRTEYEAAYAAMEKNPELLPKAAAKELGKLVAHDKGDSPRLRHGTQGPAVRLG